MELAGEKRFSIITGANMAGKSTYLRTVGINMLLAMRGLPVPVKKMTIKPTKIFTSMLSADSLGENESYFFNELKRLRQMTDRLETDEPHFIILDEILKGTNSIDKARGSRRFMQKLLKLPAKGLIATHDLSLCKLSDEHPGVIENTKFEVRFDGDELAFDYKLENGVCENMNASFLLQKMGLSE
jgi:DNA mismatch repair ATPase MutS